MEPLNKGHIGTRSFVLYREVSLIRRVKCTDIIGIGTSRFVLYREVFFIRSVLYQRFHCNSVCKSPIAKVSHLDIRDDFSQTCLQTCINEKH